MEILIITPLLADFSEKELNEKKESKSANQEPDGFVSIHAYDMIAQAYDAKCDECEKLKKEIRKLQDEKNKSEAELILRCKLSEEKRSHLASLNDELIEKIGQIQEITKNTLNHGLA